MTDEPPRNGANASQPGKRPSWYVPLGPLPDGAPAAEESLLSLKVVTNPEELGDAQVDIEEYLGRRFALRQP